MDRALPLLLDYCPHDALASSHCRIRELDCSSHCWQSSTVSVTNTFAIHAHYAPGSSDTRLISLKGFKLHAGSGCLAVGPCISQLDGQSIHIVMRCPRLALLLNEHVSLSSSTGDPLRSHGVLCSGIGLPHTPQ